MGHASLATTQLYLHAQKVLQSAISNVRALQANLRKKT
jgi:site-specific recombinase XerD